MKTLAPLSPVPWPPNKRDGDKLVPVIRGREAMLYCLYVVAPVKSRTPVKIGYTGQLSRRLVQIRSHYLYAGSERVELFWSAWFEDELQAKQLEATTHSLLESQRVRYKSEWFRVTPEWGRQAILVAANKADVPVISHERYVALCRWRSNLPSESRVPGKQRSVCDAVQEAKHAENY